MRDILCTQRERRSKYSSWVFVFFLIIVKLAYITFMEEKGLWGLI